MSLFLGLLLNLPQMVHAKNFHRFKQSPLVMVTAYDVFFASVAEQSGVDVILVGDSAANAVLGKKSTREINMDVMAIFLEGVAAGCQSTHITADMPHDSYPNPEMALKNASRFMSLGAHSVKLEGFHPEIVKILRENGIPVFGHLGLLPQSAQSLKKVGLEAPEQQRLLREARHLDQAGVIALVLEHMNSQLAGQITRSCSAPTVGIGAGPQVNGQVLVLHDLLGMNTRPLPPFAKRFADVKQTALEGLRNYTEAVRRKEFPGD
jgi:3-methyl-2-oxobutanoate hydroxymethyltransferase